ncbi:SET domain-containing protein [Pseudofulvimonas gallinarii]|jgi:SET domain-containing protein|uniref:SET domain-containing protein n=1 Tax=Pseudofulvimonas gallinarii TaxID=634155 RepID=A0A4R3LNZ3_9GAMM|nr:SET domain-containing protein-lysine N-methyltransferase [Pseudofulvimonas gallinarii]TCS99706.1 hypothetical protein EDC25_105141 [Pseudofulvimonas gallinarii]THD15257.1 SET domain-containing protein-lysine N-methyltransferase [Pseudofulvimonas gallinarii]
MSRRIIVRNSAIHGRGIFAATDLPAGIRVIEYKGTIITDAQADRLYGDSLDTGHTFLFTLNEKYIIDANQKGNSARWINHSCEPNCEAVIHVDPDGDDRKDRVFIETIRPVKAGHELTYNYGITLDVPHTKKLKAIWACRCGSKSCTGTLLQPKRRSAAK